MMPGMIMLWYGSIESIPSGWTLCDGTNSTPDLTAKFVRGAGEGAPNAPGEVGGSDSHSHPFTGDGHGHDLAAGLYINDVYPEGEYAHSTDSSPATGDTDSASNLPPYHVLCYIMKTPIP